MLGWLDDPGISIVKEGKALEGLALTSGHDPTEGGVAMGIQEICRRSDTGAVVIRESLPIREETRLLCDLFGMDPNGASQLGRLPVHRGTPAVCERACAVLRERGIPAAVIGTITEQYVV